MVDGSHESRAVSLQASELFLTGFLQKFPEQKIENVLTSMNSTIDDLRNACEKYVDFINDMISNQNLYLRRCIQRFSGSSKMAFGYLQEKESVKAYARILYRSILCLAELNVPEARKTIQEKEKPMNRIYGLMYVILTQKGSNLEGQENLLLNDVVSFLCMKSSRAMKNASDLTKDMSAWKFLLKGTALIYLGKSDLDPTGFCSEYLSQDEPTNFDLICNKKAVLSALARQTPFVPRIQYNLGDPSVLTIDGHTDITLLHVKEGVHRLNKVISNKLKSICPHLDDLPGIDSCIRDLTGIHEEGYSFLSDEINNLMEDSTHGFMDVMEKLGVTDPNAIDEGVARLFLNNCATLNADILTAVHITCGYPFRGPEYESMLIQDSYIGHRSLLVLPKEKQLVIVGRYSKTRNLGAPEHIRPKLLPKWLSDLLFKYLLYIRPAER
jgi:hypothetical protein